MPANLRFVSFFSTFNQRNCIPRDSAEFLMDSFSDCIFVPGVTRARHLSFVKIAHEFNDRPSTAAAAEDAHSQCFHIRRKRNESRHFYLFRFRTENNYVTAVRPLDVYEVRLARVKYEFERIDRRNTHTHTSHIHTCLSFEFGTVMHQLRLIHHFKYTAKRLTNQDNMYP